MPASCSSTKIFGTGTPEAMAISSTTLRRRRRLKSVVSAPIGVPPICSATDSPPPRSEATRYSEPSEVHHRDDAEHRQPEQDHEARRIPPRRRLAFEEVHVARGLELHFRRRTHLRLLLAGN